jgi:hypothetical protein
MICTICKEHYGKDDKEGICPTCAIWHEYRLFGCMPTKKEIKKAIIKQRYSDKSM